VCFVAGRFFVITVLLPPTATGSASKAVGDAYAASRISTDSCLPRARNAASS
jgi:hypothetical protein